MKGQWRDRPMGFVILSGSKKNMVGFGRICSGSGGQKD